MARKKKLKWEDKGVSIPVKLKKSVDSSRTFSSNLICEHDHSKLSQKYICKKCKDLKVLKREQKPSSKKILKHLKKRYPNEDESDLKKMINTGEWKKLNTKPERTYGQVKKRKTEIGDQELIYENKEKKNYIKQKTGKVMKVTGEIDTENIVSYIEYFNTKSTYELFNNDEGDIKGVKTLRKYLSSKNKGLIVEYGYYSKKRRGVVIISNGKLLIMPLRDSRKIREINQKEYEGQIHETLEEHSKDENIDLQKEYFRKKMNGEEIEVEQEEEMSEETSLGELEQEIEEKPKVKA